MSLRKPTLANVIATPYFVTVTINEELFAMSSSGWMFLPAFPKYVYGAFHPRRVAASGGDVWARSSLSALRGPICGFAVK